MSSLQRKKNIETQDFEIKKSREELEKAKKETEEYKNKYLRALADYQNLDKRAKEEKEDLVRTANRQLILKLIPVLDNLEKAEIFIKDKGLKIVKDSFYQMLKEIGVTEIDILGKEFDPHLAEAIEVVAGEKDNIVVEVLKKGYKLNNTILRVAQVKVSKKVNNY